MKQTIVKLSRNVKIFIIQTIFIYFIIIDISKSAKVLSVEQTTNLNFGKIAAENGGVLRSYNCSGSLTIKTFGNGCHNGSFTVVGNNNESQSIKVFLVNQSTNNDNIRIDVSLSPTSNVISQSFKFESGDGNKIINIPVYGALSLEGSHNGGNYSTNYRLIACSCDNNGCPDDQSDSRCNTNNHF